jgi:hypothetical protein
MAEGRRQKAEIRKKEEGRRKKGWVLPVIPAKAGIPESGVGVGVGVGVCGGVRVGVSVGGAPYL